MFREERNNRGKKIAIFLMQGEEKCLAWELGVVYEFVLSSRGDCQAKPASCHLFCSPSAKFHLSGMKCLECSIG